MKSIVILILILVICYSKSQAQNQTILLKPKIGHEYVFERTEKEFYILKDKSNDKIVKDYEKLKIEIKDLKPDSFLLFSYKTIKNYRELLSPVGVMSRTDFIYPDFNEMKLQFPRSSDFIKSSLTKYTFLFSVNLKNKEIVLLNKEEILKSYQTKLIELDFTQKEIEESIAHLKHRKYFIPEKKLSFLAKFHNAQITDDKIISKEKYIVREKTDELIGFGDLDFDHIIDNKEYQKYWINLENGLITNYATTKYERLKPELKKYNNSTRYWRVNESNFRMIYSCKIPENKVVISGKIKNQLSKNIHIRFLDKPFGTDLHTKSYNLNENGVFFAEFEYHHNGFIYINNGYNKGYPNEYNGLDQFVLYAEPGDTINLESKGKRFNVEVSFSGTKKVEAEYLQELRNNISNYTRENNLILYYDPYFGISRAGGEAKFKGNVQPLFDGLKKLEQISKKYQSQLPEKSFNFITNETKAFLLAGIYDYASRISMTKQFMLIKYGNIKATNLDDFPLIEPDYEFKDIHDIYNDFGLQSRKLVRRYFDYHYNEINKANTRFSLSFRINYIPATESNIQFARMILSGSPLYRQIGASLSDALISKSKNVVFQEHDFVQEFALKKSELLVKLCNDKEIVKEIETLLEQREQLQNQSYLPELEFINRKKQKVTFDNYFGKKPSIFYFSYNWVGVRYQIEDEFAKNPDLNFIMIVEGNSFEQWEEYTNLADPKANHLLLNNDSVSIPDIFHKSSVYLVFDKKGNFEGYAKDLKGAIKKANNTLTEKTEKFSNSQLRNIIWVMGILIVIAFIIFLIWKWRNHQQRLKAKQQTRLRELELTAIRSQMNPHFLFNSLNSVQNLIQQNKSKEAHLYLADFAFLIRKVMHNSEKEELALAEEIEMTKLYLNLEKLRFDFDFTISINPKIDINNTMIPSMLLQPFVENAIIHGLINKPEPRKLKIEVLLKNNGILVIIEDNGIGRKAAQKSSSHKNGKGTKLIKERLEILQEKQGERYSIETIDLNDTKTGTLVEIFIPEEN